VTKHASQKIQKPTFLAQSQFDAVRRVLGLKKLMPSCHKVMSKPAREQNTAVPGRRIMQREWEPFQGRRIVDFT